MSDPKDYAHTRDPEAQRTRAELWAIVVIVVIVVVGGLIWRVVEHKPAGARKGYTNGQNYPNPAAIPAAAGVHSTLPSPRPIGP